MWQSTLSLFLLSLLRLVWLNFGLPFYGPRSQDFLAFSFSREKEVFFNASLRICCSFQNREEPLAHFDKTLSIVFGSSKGENGFENTLKWHCRKLCYNLRIVVMLCYVYVDAKKYHLASFSTRNFTLNTSLRWPIRMRDNNNVILF